MIYLLIASMIWAVVFGVTKYILPGVDPQLIAFIRCAIAALIFSPFFFYRNNQVVSNKVKIKVIFIGCLYGLMYTPYIMAYKYLSAYQVGLMTLTASLYICFFYDWYEKKLHPRSYIYALCSIVGSVIILYREDSLGMVLKGAVLIEMASLCFAFAQVSYKKLKQDNPNVSDKNMFAYVHLASAIVASIMCLILSDYSKIMSITSREWGALIYLGIFATGVAFYMWNKGCTKVSISLIAVANNTKIPMIAILSYFVFNENDHPIQLIIGSTVIAVAFFASEFDSIKKRYLKSV